MRKIIILVSILAVITGLHAQDRPWVDGFSFQAQQIAGDEHEKTNSYVERASVMSQWDKHRNQDEDCLDQTSLQSYAAERQQKFIAEENNQYDVRQAVTLEQELKPAQSSLFAQCQQFFMNVFAFLYKK